MNDIADAKFVEITVRNDNKVIWVNVDGICALRISRVDNITIEIENRFRWQGESGNIMKVIHADTTEGADGV